MLLFKEKEMALEKESELIERRILLAFSQKQAIYQEIAPKSLSDSRHHVIYVQISHISSLISKI